MSEICDIGVAHPESPSPLTAGGMSGAAAREIDPGIHRSADHRRELVATMARRAPSAAKAAVAVG